MDRLPRCRISDIRLDAYGFLLPSEFGIFFVYARGAQNLEIRGGWKIRPICPLFIWMYCATHALMQHDYERNRVLTKAGITGLKMNDLNNILLKKVVCVAYKNKRTKSISCA